MTKYLLLLKKNGFIVENYPDGIYFFFFTTLSKILTGFKE